MSVVCTSLISAGTKPQVSSVDVPVLLANTRSWSLVVVPYTATRPDE